MEQSSKCWNEIKTVAHQSPDNYFSWTETEQEFAQLVSTNVLFNISAVITHNYDQIRKL